MAKTYDYDLQKWVDDPTLRLSQLTDEVELLKSPQGPEFAAFINVDYSTHLAEAEANLLAHLATMEGGRCHCDIGCECEAGCEICARG